MLYVKCYHVLLLQLLSTKSIKLDLRAKKKQDNYEKICSF